MCTYLHVLMTSPYTSYTPREEKQRSNLDFLLLHALQFYIHQQNISSSGLVSRVIIPPAFLKPSPDGGVVTRRYPQSFLLKHD
jgi:hypothetical protein